VISTELRMPESCAIKAKFHYASWFGAGSKPNSGSNQIA